MLKYGQYPDWITQKPKKGDLMEKKKKKNFTKGTCPRNH